jgi:hypothetical protein
MTAQSDLAAIRKIVKNTDERRTRSRREAFAAIKTVLDGEKLVEEVPTPEEELIEEVFDEPDTEKGESATADED